MVMCIHFTFSCSMIGKTVQRDGADSSCETKTCTIHKFIIWSRVMQETEGDESVGCRSRNSLHYCLLQASGN